MLDSGNVDVRSHHHEIHFYSSDAVFVETVANFVATGLVAGGAAIAFATKAHHDVLRQALTLQDVSIDAAIEHSAYIPLDAVEVLSMFMVRGCPDRTRFFEGFDRLIGFASKGAKNENPRIAVFGEGVALLCEEGNLKLRSGWNNSATISQRDTTLRLCARILYDCARRNVRAR